MSVNAGQGDVHKHLSFVSLFGSDSLLSWAGVPVVPQWLTNPTSIREEESSIPGLAQWVKDLVLPGAGM